MPALAKPHRVAVLMPELRLEGAVDLGHAPEAALVVWMAMIEVLQRHPLLAVYDAESTPIAPRNGHFSPQHAAVGATPTDAFFGPTRRDELVWLEIVLAAGKAGVVRLHAMAKSGKQQVFDAIGRRLGDQIDQALAAWLAARELGALPRRFEAIALEDLAGVARAIGPVLVDAARRPLPIVADAERADDADDADVDSEASDAGDDHADDDDGDDDGNSASFDDRDDTDDGSGRNTERGDRAGFEDADDDDGDDDDDDDDNDDDNDNDNDNDNDDDADDDNADDDDDTSARNDRARSARPRAPGTAFDVVAPTTTARIGRTTALRAPAALKVPALRVLALALAEPLDDLILAADPEHPQALLATMIAGEPDYTRIRRAIAAAPGWARPYAELTRGYATLAPGAPNALETLAASGLALMGRPGNMRILDAAADALDELGCIDEGIRLMERAVALHDTWSSRISLLEVVRSSDRVGVYLEEAHRAGALHGCPMDASWYPDQIQTDLWVSEALLHAGRLDEAIALRANRLEGRAATWPRHTRILETWRKDPRLVAWSYAREGHLRGDDARAAFGFGRIEPGDTVDTKIFLDALVAMGRESEVPLAWAQFGLGRGHAGPVARLAAARGLLAAGDWRRGLEELWRAELGDPSRDAHTEIARAGLILSIAPIDVSEIALGDRVAIGATTLARRMARDIADFVPAAASSSLVARALANRGAAVDFDPAWLAGFVPSTPSRAALAALFADATAGKDDARTRGDRLVDRWLEVAFTEASEDDPAALVQAAAYAAAQALARYLAATTGAPSPIAGALRTVAGEALALVRVHRAALRDREARAILVAIEPLLRRVDRWVGSAWLGAVERSCAIDERARGDVAGFARDLPTVAARVLGPEEAAVLAASVTRLARDKPAGWAAAVATQAERLALHTGFVGVEEWADATVAQLGSRAVELDDAIDALHTACFLAQGRSARPALHAARILVGAGRAPAALAVLTTGLSAATPAERDAALATLADDWKKTGIDVPLAFDRLAAGMFEALQKTNPARAEKLGRLAVALDPDNAEAHRNLGLALAQQGKTVDALVHLVRATPEQATQILAGVLYRSGKVTEAMAVLDYASRWYVRADQWLTYGGIAYEAMSDYGLASSANNPRTARAYGLAWQLDPEAFDASQLNAYAGVLDEVGDYATCAKIAKRLFVAAGDDKMWQTCAWNHEACALIGTGEFPRAIELAQRAVAENPNANNREPFSATLLRAQSKLLPPAPPAAPAFLVSGEYLPGTVFAQLAAGEHARAAARLTDRDWKVRRGALAAAQFRFSSENAVAVTARARAAAAEIAAITIGATDPDAILCRAIAHAIREQAHFARDPVVSLGDRMTRAAFYQEFRARGGVVLGEAPEKAVAFVDRVVVAGAKVARASDYVALLRDLATLAPREALAQFDLTPEDYIELSAAWGAAFDRDPELAPLIAAGLAAAAR